MNELKPCPFCGSGAVELRETAGYNGPEYQVRCLVCGCRTRRYFQACYSSEPETKAEQEAKQKARATACWNLRK